MPTTRSASEREAAFATWHIASSGFETTTRIASRERLTTSRVTCADDRLVRRHEVVAAHPGRARLAGRDHDHVGALGLVVAVRAEDVRLEAEHRAGLVHVERLALREVRDDVDEDDVRVVAARELEGAGGADVAGADDGDFSTQLATPSLSMIASATSLVPTAVGSSRVGFMSYVTLRALADHVGDRRLEPVGRVLLVEVAEHQHPREHLRPSG